MIPKIYKLKALTNLHVGSGDLSFGVVDKLVQRDPVSRFPVIHASSMKGSLKEFCENEPDLMQYIKPVFGESENSGKNKFFAAHLLILPARSNRRPYFKATCPAIIKQLIESLNAFGVHKESIDSLERLYRLNFVISSGNLSDFILFKKDHQTVTIEDWSKPKFVQNFKWDEQLIRWLGEKEDFVLMQDEFFKEICENLPVVARNQIGEQRNLWYEELVPRQSEFWFCHLLPKRSTTENNSIEIIKKIKSKKIPVQIGANASVGCGYCEFLIP